MIKTLLTLTFGVGLALGAAACGGSKEAPPKTVVTARPVVTMLPEPSGTPVIEITRAGADPVSADFATLDGLARKTYNLVEPFEKRLMAFKGVELWSVLAGAGVPESATEVKLTALDDYQVTLSVADLLKGGVILATQIDGSNIPLDHGGPTRVVFLDGVEAGRNPDQWIWSVAHIAVS